MIKTCYEISKINEISDVSVIDEVSDEEFEKIVAPFESKTKTYLEKISYEYVAYYIATEFKLGIMLDESLAIHINTALDDLGRLNDKINLKNSIVKKLLEKKYGLIITNDDPLAIVDTKKEDQH